MSKSKAKRPARDLAALADGPAIVELKSHVENIIAENRIPSWLEVSSEPMTATVRNIGREQFALFPMELVQPVSWRDMSRMSECDSDTSRLDWLAARPWIFCFMLSNQTLGDEVRTLSRHELLTSDRLISFLF